MKLSMKWLGLMGLVAILCTLSCSKESIDSIPVRERELTAGIAKTWYEQSYRPKISVNSKSRFSDLTPDWEKAEEGQSKQGDEFVEVPLKSTKRTRYLYAIEDEYHPGKQIYLARNSNLWLVIYTEDGQRQASVKEIESDEKYLKIHRETINGDDFSGRVFSWTWSGDLIGGSHYEKGVRDATIKPIQLSNSSGAREPVCTIYTTCYWSSSCSDPGEENYDPYWGYGAPPSAYGTSTTSLGMGRGCNYPDYGHGSESGGPNCSPWELVDSDSYQQCYNPDGWSSTSEGSGVGSGGVVAPPSRIVSAQRTNKNDACTAFSNMWNRQTNVTKEQGAFITSKGIYWLNDANNTATTCEFGTALDFGFENGKRFFIENGVKIYIESLVHTHPFNPVGGGLSDRDLALAEAYNVPIYAIDNEGIIKGLPNKTQSIVDPDYLKAFNCSYTYYLFSL